MHHVVVHAHCYQPPREDPWLEIVEAEPSASPDHDWNVRIDRECYARLAGAEVRQPLNAGAMPDPEARTGIAGLINLYAWCSFDVGATLCEWMDLTAPTTMRAMIEGDRASVRRWGHGNAIAAPYHHVILPLASPRDRRTEVRWGIADFTRRFGRLPEGMWLPECAADEDTLDLLAAEGIRFTILAPYQVQTDGETHGLPVLWRGAAGRSLTILPYDGALAGEVAFGGLLRDAEALQWRLAPGLDDGQTRCTTLATDGETFGHHHRGGDQTLAQAMVRLAQRRNAGLTNAATVVATHPATLEARLVSPSSWSCAHGVQRWRESCGCRLDQYKAPAQQWRGPLRSALSALAAECHQIFEHEGRELFADDPWTVRDGYGTVVSADGTALADFVRAALRAHVDDRSLSRARQLLELERAVLRCFTSCAWFFDEVDRIETRQVLRYAARALELSGHASRLVPELIHWLEPARAAVPDSVTAADVLVRSAMPHRHPTWSVAAGAIALVAGGHPCERVAAYDVAVAPQERPEWPWQVRLEHRRTGDIAQFWGSVVGEGPSLRISLIPANDGATGPQLLAIHDLPEPVSTQLLQPFALHDRALTG